MAILEISRYHNYCGEKLGERSVRISAGGYKNPNFLVDFCPECEVYMYYHRNGGIESRNLHDVESYISNLILERQAPVPPIF
jgi:hypothetical protein